MEQGFGQLIRRLGACIGPRRGFTKVIPGREDSPEPVVSQTGMGAGTHAQVRAVLPVDQIVTAGPARLGPVGDLIVVIGRRRQRPSGVLVHVGGQVRVGLGDLPLRRPAVHGRPFFKGQSVERDVLRGQAGQRVQGPPPLLHGLVGQPVHQVQVDVVETGLAGGLERLDRFGCLVAASQQVQEAVVQALNPDAKPVDALTEDAGAGRRVQVVWVGLDGDLSARVHLERCLDGSEDLFDMARRQV